MIKSCKFGTTIEPSSLCARFQNNTASKVFTPRMGLCHVFNFESRNQTENLVIDTANIYSGLTLEIDIECKQFYDQQATYAEKKNW